MKAILSLCLLAVLGIHSPAFGFKPKTHVWVAQQVLNDVAPDGMVTIPPFGDFAVPENVATALRNYPQHYRMGHIGPDAFPDVIGGQVTMHPGDGWPSGHWIRHLFAATGEPSVVAFAHGYAGHAAGDAFAHSYVNLYSGDIFSLADEQAVEVRHFSLEDFIARHTPSLIDNTGSPVPFELLDVNPEAIRDLLVYAPADQYTTSAPHLALMAAYRRSLTEAEQLTAQFKLDLATNYLQPQLEILKLQITAVEQLKTIYDSVQNEESRLRARLHEIPGEIGKVENTITNLQAQAANLVSDAGRLACLAGCELCTGKISLPGGGSIGCDKGECQGGCNGLFDSVNRGIAEAQSLLKRLNDEKADVNTKLMDIANQIADAKSKYESALGSQALRLAKQAVADVQAVVDSANIIEGLLRLWRMDVDRAVAAYIVMSKEMAIELVKSNGSPLSPFSRWLQCWAPVFSGVPSAIPQAACAGTDLLARFRSDYQRFMDSLGSIRYIIDPVGQITEDLKRKYKQQVIDLVEAEINRGLVTLFVSLGRDDLAHVVNLLMQGSEGNTLNDHYSQDRSGKGLLKISDIRERVLADMHLTPAGVFDAAAYRPAYNAVILAKLSLLERQEVVRLVQLAGGDPASVPTTTPFNVLIDVLKSIDGNHQWQVQAPPYFRQDGWYPRAKEEFPQYALDRFVLWNGDHREKLFMKIFVGPLAENLEAPCPVEFSDLIHPGYPYRACQNNPFPSTDAEPSNNICQPKLVVEKLHIDVEQPHLLITTTTINNRGGGAAGGTFRYTICESECKRERLLLKGTLRSRICASRPESRTDTVLLPYLHPGGYNLKLVVTQSGSKNGVEKVHHFEVPPCREMYTIRKGDTLYGLGEKFGIDPWKIAARNRILALSEISAGRKVCIP